MIRPWSNAAQWPSHTTVPARIYETGSSPREAILKPDQGFPTSGALGPALVVVPAMHPGVERIAEPTVFAVDQHIQRPGVTVVYGVAKLGKSRFVQHLLLSLLSGRPFLGQFAAQCDPNESVLIVAAEETVQEVSRSLRQQCEGLGIVAADSAIASRLLACPPAAYRFFDERGQPRPEFELLKAAIAEWRPAVVVIDTFSDTLGFAPENATDAMRNVFSLLRHVAIAYHVGVVLVDHEGHPQQTRDGELRETGRPRGSSQKVAEANVLIRLQRASHGEENPRQFTVSIVSRRKPIRYRYQSSYGESGDEQRFGFVEFVTSRSVSDRLRTSLRGIAEKERSKGAPLLAAEVLQVLRGNKETRLALRDDLASAGYLCDLKGADEPQTTASKWTVTAKGHAWLIAE